MVLNYRVHDNQLSNGGRSSDREEKCANTLYRAFSESLSQTPSEAVPKKIQHVNPEVFKLFYMLMKKKSKALSRENTKQVMNLMKVILSAECLDKKTRSILFARFSKKLIRSLSLSRALKLLKSSRFDAN